MHAFKHRQIQYLLIFFQTVARAFRMAACAFAVNHSTFRLLQTLTHSFPPWMQTPNSCQISKSVPHMYSQNPMFSPWPKRNISRETQVDLHEGNQKHGNNRFPNQSVKLEKRTWPCFSLTCPDKICI